ncbi:hypothetical protein SDC9_194035 [bioreactor metagenome]|uniref:Uncharacterized protein n=1 Tax=bioreactor metagenome TaxID=1076179 RepID=A0A645I7T5_9ZZZZ
MAGQDVDFDNAPGNRGTDTRHTLLIELDTTGHTQHFSDGLGTDHRRFQLADQFRCRLDRQWIVGRLVGRRAFLLPAPGQHGRGQQGNHRFFHSAFPPGKARSRSISTQAAANSWRAVINSLRAAR